MQVNEILQQIANLSLNEDRPDGYLLARHVQWLNNTYKEVIRLTQDIAPHRLLEVGSYNVSDSLLMFSTTPTKIKKIYNCTTKEEIEVKELNEILECDPCLDSDYSDGDTLQAYWSKNELKFYPNAWSGRVTLHELPQANTLKVDDPESAIWINPQWHDMLVNGSLRYNAYDERDVSSLNEIALKKQEFEQQLNDYQHHLHTLNKLYRTNQREDF